MKRILVCCLLALLLLLTACSEPGQDSVVPASGEAETVTELPYLLDTNEYAMYTNIFYNGMAGDYLGQTQTKNGTLAIVRDSFNGCTRYYVWGYLDETRCCDWQWEFVPKSPEELPAVGSLVEVTGVFSESEDALDGYWLTEAEVGVGKHYQGPETDYRLTTMSCTLERVQMLNMQYFPDDYEGKSVRFYGRVLDDGTIQDPYYDGSWKQAVTYEGQMPPIGTMVVATGSFREGELIVTELTQSNSY